MDREACAKVVAGKSGFARIVIGIGSSPVVDVPVVDNFYSSTTLLLLLSKTKMNQLSRRYNSLFLAFSLSFPVTVTSEWTLDTVYLLFCLFFSHFLGMIIRELLYARLLMATKAYICMKKKKKKGSRYANRD